MESDPEPRPVGSDCLSDGSGGGEADSATDLTGTGLSSLQT